MKQSKLDIIRPCDFYLTEGISSSEVRVKDKDGDMFFSFLITYIDGDSETGGSLRTTDKFHATIIIRMSPSISSSTINPVLIGSIYGKKNLYLSFRVLPCDRDGLHHLTALFLTD